MYSCNTFCSVMYSLYFLMISAPLVESLDSLLIELFKNIIFQKTTVFIPCSILPLMCPTLSSAPPLLPHHHYLLCHPPPTYDLTTNPTSPPLTTLRFRLFYNFIYYFFLHFLTSCFLVYSRSGTDNTGTVFVKKVLLLSICQFS